MKRIEVAGIPFFYFSKRDGFPLSQVEGITLLTYITLPRWQLLFEGNLTDIRAVIWVPPENDVRQISPLYFLHWSNGIDLEELDRRVIEGTYTGEDFEDAILTSPDGMICLNNYDWGADILEPENIFPSHAIDEVFTPRWLARADQGKYIRHCPGCGKPINKTIAKILRIRDKDELFPPPNRRG